MTERRSSLVGAAELDERDLDRERARAYMLLGDVASAVAENTRDLARIGQQLSALGEHLEARKRQDTDDVVALQQFAASVAALEAHVEQVQSTQEMIMKVVFHGNGQKSVLQQIGELSVRVDAAARRMHGGGPGAGAGLVEVKGKWRTIEAVVRWIGPAFITGAIELVTHLHANIP